MYDIYSGMRLCVYTSYLSIHSFVESTMEKSSMLTIIVCTHMLICAMFAGMCHHELNSCIQQQ